MKSIRRLASHVLWAISNRTGQWAWEIDPDAELYRALAKHGALPIKKKAKEDHPWKQN